MKIANILLKVIYILSLRFGFQTELVIIYPDNVVKSRKRRHIKTTDERQELLNWR